MELNYYLIGNNRYESLDVHSSKNSDLIVFQPYRTKIETKIKELESIIGANFYPLKILNKIMLTLFVGLFFVLTITFFVFVICGDQKSSFGKVRNFKTENKNYIYKNELNGIGNLDIFYCESLKIYSDCLLVY